MKRVILLSLTILLISLAYSFAGVPCKINYQGRLIENNVPVDGTKTMVFSIYTVATEGSPIWSSGNVSVEVHNGLFRYVIGSDGKDLSGIFQTAGQTLYLEVMVDGETLTPREELSAYPYAINSHLLEGATKEYFLNTSAEAQTKQGNLNIMGNLGVGTTGPGAMLHIKKNAAGWADAKLENTAGSAQLTLDSVANNYSIIGFTRAGANRWYLGMTGDDKFLLRDTNVGASRISVDTAGNVGIGTAPGNWKLNVAGGDNSFTWAGDHSSSNYIRIGDLQICWGRAFIYGSASGIESIGFPAAFSETARVIVNRLTQGAYSNFPDFHIFVKNVNVNLFDLEWYGAQSGWTIAGKNYGHYHDWIAIGRWQ